MEVRDIDKPATEQPGNSFRYAYQYLTEKHFQQLCGALLSHHFDVFVFPVGMADGGIDALAPGAIAYQVKWSSKVVLNPHTWLKRTIEDEKPKIRRLIEQGRISKYILITSVAGTTTAQRTGSMQKLEKDLETLSNELGIPVECWWQSQVDALMDSAPLETKLSYPDCLVGSDAILHLIHGSQASAEAQQMRDTVRQVMMTQWEEDSRVKFSQFDMDHINVADLFVDVQASLVSPPRKAAQEAAKQHLADLPQKGGALKYLLKARVPLTLLLGVPGQGKSTLGQYLCQVHRAAILFQDSQQGHTLPGVEVENPKLPLRVDLKDYAAWLEGRDPYGEDEPPKKPKRRPKKQQSLDQFLAEFCHFNSRGRSVSVEQLQSLLERFPVLLVLDGLDEIGDTSLRSIVVEQIDALASRMANHMDSRSFQILVTARPNASGLAEPSGDTFERLSLEPMNGVLRQEFFKKWRSVNGVTGTQGRKLKRIFDDRTALDHVAKLADNPMQLTILLYLIKRKGDAVPTSRTQLYSDYMGILLDREVDRQQIERHQVPRVEEVTSFLGWHLHTEMETNSSAGRMPRKSIVSTVILYFREVDSDYDDAEELFRAASDRFWALTSKVEGTFEFSVQPVREYFAARFLAQWAARDRSTPLTKREVLAQLISRPFWLNTLQFYAGFADPNELASLRYGIQDALEAGDRPLQERVAAWALLSDGTFANDTKVQRDVVRELADDLSLVLIARNTGAGAYFPALAAVSGGEQLATELLTALERNPSDSLAMTRVELLREHTSMDQKKFRDWWKPKLQAALGTPQQNLWVRLGATYRVPAIDYEDVTKLALETTADRRAALAVGATPEARSTVDQKLLRSVLSGECSDVRTSSNSEAGALLRAMRPQWYHQLSEDSHDGPTTYNGHFWLSEKARKQRSVALSRLVEIDPNYGQLKKAANARAKGKKGTTEPWQETARTLYRIHGPSLLAAEIAVAGAASYATTPEGSNDPGGEPFGENVDYGTLVMAVHKRPNSQWWSDTYARYTDSLSRTTWVLALLATAGKDVVAEHLSEIDGHIHTLETDDFEAVAAASSRLGVSNLRRRLDAQILSHTAECSTRTKLLVSHFVANPGQDFDKLDGLSDADLCEMATPEPHRWPVVQALSQRLLGSPNDTLLAGLENAGPDAHLRLDLDYAWRNIELSYLYRILEHPAKYPSAWVVVAEQARSQLEPEPILESLAVTEGWVPEVPRLQR